MPSHSSEFHKYAEKRHLFRPRFLLNLERAEGLVLVLVLGSQVIVNITVV